MVDIAITTFSEEVVTGSTGTSITLDLASANTFVYTLTGDVDVSVTNPTTNLPGQSFTLILEQDATGGRAVTSWPSGIEWSDGTAPNLDTTPGVKNVVSFITTDGGTSYIGFVSGLGVQ